MNGDGQVKAMVMVPALRRLIASLLAYHQALDDACLLASEMISNALWNTRSGAEEGTITVAVNDVGHATRIEVIDQDGSNDHPQVRDDVPADSESGYSLHLVAALAVKWDAVPWGDPRHGSKSEPRMHATAPTVRPRSPPPAVRQWSPDETGCDLDTLSLLLDGLPRSVTRTSDHHETQFERGTCRD